MAAVRLARLTDGQETPGSEHAGPFIIGITGGVAVGKSTVASVLADLLRNGDRERAVDLFSTDAFLLSNQQLEARGLADRKGFPESYDHHRLGVDLAAIRDARIEVAVPVYSHRIYDILPGAVQWIRHPQVVIIEGLTVLQEPVGPDPAVADFVDFSIYVDGDEGDMGDWFRRRLMDLHAEGDRDAPFFRWFCELSEAEASEVADHAWTDINLVNLRQHVAPTRSRADVVLVKGADHRVDQIWLRRG